MRRVILSEFITLDGFIDEPAWTGPYFNEEVQDYKFRELFESDALLLGRVTYDGFAEAWPNATDEQGFADRMNSLPKHVASTSLTKLDWNNSSLLKDNLVEEVARLKAEPGQDILMYGSSTLADAMTQTNLIDEYRLMVFPVIKGQGKRFFKDDTNKNLKLAGSQMFSSGVVVLIYHPEDLAS